MSAPFHPASPAYDLLNSADAALSVLNDADDQHLGDLESFAELLAHLVERPDDTLTTSALAALAANIDRHAEAVAVAMRTAVEMLRPAVMRGYGTDAPN
jgi:hypothetical protein